MTSNAAAVERRWIEPGTKDDDAIEVDEEFESWIVPLSRSERAGLHHSLERDGCRDALLVWKEHGRYILVDGHNRIRHCRLMRIRYSVIEMEFADRAAVKAYISEQQAGRRNLSAVAESYLRGKRYLEMRHQGKKGKTSGHDDPKRASETLAEVYKVGEKTIRRDGELAAAVDRIVSNGGPKARDLVLSRDSRLRHGGILSLARLAPEAQKVFLEVLEKEGKAPRKPRQQRAGSMTVPTEMKALAATLVEKLGAREMPSLFRCIIEALRDHELAEVRREENRASEGESHGSYPSLTNERPSAAAE